MPFKPLGIIVMIVRFRAVSTSLSTDHNTNTMDLNKTHADGPLIVSPRLTHPGKIQE